MVHMLNDEEYETYSIEMGDFPYFRTWDYEGEVFKKGTPVYEGKKPPFKKRILKKNLEKDEMSKADYIYIRKVLK